jgi:hypothetical protein
VVRRDDHLGVERRPSFGCVRVDDVPHDLRRRKERVQLRLAGQGLGEIDDSHNAPSGVIFVGATEDVRRRAA